ncbi:MAG: hypothetical protein M3Q64_01725 [bacterium]|nr:hypothetical protein [bacterium]
MIVLNCVLHFSPTLPVGPCIKFANTLFDELVLMNLSQAGCVAINMDFNQAAFFETPVQLTLSATFKIEKQNYILQFDTKSHITSITEGAEWLVAYGYLVLMCEDFIDRSEQDSLSMEYQKLFASLGKKLMMTKVCLPN